MRHYEPQLLWTPKSNNKPWNLHTALNKCNILNTIHLSLVERYMLLIEDNTILLVSNWAPLFQSHIPPQSIIHLLSGFSDSLLSLYIIHGCTRLGPTQFIHILKRSKFKNLVSRISQNPFVLIFLTRSIQQWAFVCLVSERLYLPEIKHLQKGWMHQRATLQCMWERIWNDLWFLYHTWTNLYSKTCWVKQRKSLDMIIPWVASQFLAPKMSSNI